MRNKNKLRVEIIPDPGSGKTRVLIWEGIVIVSNQIIERVENPTKELADEYEREYIKELTKEP